MPAVITARFRQASTAMGRPDLRKYLACGSGRPKADAFERLNRAILLRESDCSVWGRAECR